MEWGVGDGGGGANSRDSIVSNLVESVLPFNILELGPFIIERTGDR